MQTAKVVWTGGQKFRANQPSGIPSISTGSHDEKAWANGTVAHGARRLHATDIVIIRRKNGKRWIGSK